MKPIDFTNVRNEIRKMYIEQGHSRMASDYAYEWLLERLPDTSRDMLIIRSGLEKPLTQIAEEVMKEDMMLSKQLYREGLRV